jgi:hypothetical protein
MEDGSPKVDYAYLSWEPYSKLNSSLELYVGLIKPAYGLDNEIRDIASAHTMILLPQSVYGEFARDPLEAQNGLKLKYRHKDFLLQSMVVMMRKDPGAYTDIVMQTAAQGHMRGNHLSWLYNIQWSPHQIDGLTIGYMRTYASYKYELSGPNDYFGEGNAPFSASILSFRYQTGPFTLTTEWMNNHFIRNSFAIPQLNTGDTPGQGYYATLEWRVNNHWNTYASYGETYYNRDDKSGAHFQAVTGYPAFTQYAKDATLGLAYYINPQWMTRFEYHHIDGTFWLSPIENPNIASLKPHWNMGMAQIVYTFR